MSRQPKSLSLQRRPFRGPMEGWVFLGAKYPLLAVTTQSLI